MWDLIFNPFVTLLTWMYSIFNQDIIMAIVVFTIIIRIVTYPLLAKQQESSKRMQELQPRLKKLQEKYKDDREKLAQAQMAMYKEAGVNPLGGCLPTLIQFPIIIGLYQAIMFALAASPYQLVDLSERLLIPGLDGLIPLQNEWLGMNLTQPPSPPLNPEYALVLPILVMVTTWLSFKFSMPNMGASSGGATDQAQSMTRSMTTIMPIMFGAFALSFSVGLSVYFIVSNLAAIVQYSPTGKKGLDWLFRTGQYSRNKAPLLPDIDDEDEPADAKPSAKPKVVTGTSKTVRTPKKPLKTKARR